MEMSHIVDLFQKLLVFMSLVVTSICAPIREDSQEDYYRHYPSSVPDFLPVPTNITVHEGETAHMRCRIHNLGPKLVVWRKTNEESPLTYGKVIFTPNKNVEVEAEEISEDENRWDLIIKNVSQDQAGIYACQIAAKNNYTQNITLNVLDPVEYKPELRLTGTEYVSLMEDIHLTCNATGSVTAPDAVDWFFNGEPISEIKSGKWYGRLVELNSKPVPGRSLISELIVKRVTMSDRGHYVCRLSKKIADGFKVHVLNDKKNHKDPKRDMKDMKDGQHAQGGEYSDTIRSHDTNNANTITVPHVTVTLLVMLWLVTVFQ